MGTLQCVFKLLLYNGLDHRQRCHLETADFAPRSGKPAAEGSESYRVECLSSPGRRAKFAIGARSKLSEPGARDLFFSNRPISPQNGWFFLQRDVTVQITDLVDRQI